MLVVDSVIASSWRLLDCHEYTPVASKRQQIKSQAIELLTTINCHRIEESEIDHTDRLMDTEKQINTYCTFISFISSNICSGGNLDTAFFIASGASSGGTGYP